MRVERLPSPGETLLGTGYRVDYGGKGSNQAVGCARLGAQVSFVARIGNDAFGEMALGLYRDEGIDVASVTCPRRADRRGLHHRRFSRRKLHHHRSRCQRTLDGYRSFQSNTAFRSTAVVLTQLEIPVAAAEAAMARGRAEARSQS